MTFDRTLTRRETLAHCLSMADKDERYAKWAARNYETSWPDLFKGLEARFTRDWREIKIAKEKEAA